MYTSLFEIVCAVVITFVATVASKVISSVQRFSAEHATEA